MFDKSRHLVAAAAALGLGLALFAAPPRVAAQYAPGAVPPPPPPELVPPPPPPPAAPMATAEIRVRASATFEARPDEPSVAYRAKVIINGTAVGETPYAAAFQPGRYVVDVEDGALRASTEIDIAAGVRYSVNARFYVPMTAQEKRAAAEVELEKARAAQAAADARWAEIHGAWEKEDAAARAKRKPHVISGTALIIGGTGLAIAGIVCASLMSEEQDKYLDTKDRWENAIDPEEIDGLHSDMVGAADARDADRGMAIAFLAIGGAAVVTSAVLFSIMPKRPEEPKREATEFAVLPLVGPDTASLSVRVRF
jgi:hypothetical protein